MCLHNCDLPWPVPLVITTNSPVRIPFVFVFKHSNGYGIVWFVSSLTNVSKISSPEIIPSGL